MISRRQKGFTLIELMVVIAIIGLMASTVLVAVQGARAKGRNARRMSDMLQIRNALELYRSSNNNSYPNPGWGWRSQCQWGPYAANNVIPGLVPTYLPVWSDDPQLDTVNSKNCYLYLSNGTHYKLLDHDVTDLNPIGYASVPSFMDPGRPTWAWMITDYPVQPPAGCGSVQWTDSSQPSTYGYNWPICW